MNIAIFTPDQNPYSETFIQAHKTYLKDSVFYYYGRKNIQLEGVSRLSTPWERRWLNIKRKIFKKSSSFIQDTIIIKSLQKNQIDVVLAEYGTHAHFILPFIKKAGLPLVVHFHGYDASVTKVVENHKNYKEVFQYASKVIAVSRKMQEMVLEMGCPEEKLVYNVYGPQPAFVNVHPTFEKKQFIAIGRFTDKKAPYYTILAFKKAVENHPDANLIMAGDGPLLNTCKNLVSYLGIEDQVEFPGIITSYTYQQLLAESLGFVQHSLIAENVDMEGTPLAVLEASAAGIPVVSTIHAGIPDVIINGETGLLCEEHDVEQMAANMLALLVNIELAKKLGQAGKENIAKNFSLERHIDALQDILEQSKS
ncbi:glycosyltransferase [Psychroflexus sp. YR1-1]|uniref:Glycosyltransferase n=1 Tax=Psychroflexus aurantiacus TaxID=2709310 RepID=A0A6B3R457_9FLAO|nr:glycosyltransferase [Psychroflexus aurantiacus]NEV93947.1 glycosyltransferase [Psychroflexus aurantiacus]